MIRSRYTSCALDGAAFDCPLPAGVEACHRAGVPPPKPGKSDQCLDTAPVSVACALEFITVASNAAYSAAAGKLSADMKTIFQSPEVGGCVQVSQNGWLLGRRGRSLPAHVSGLDTHRDSISSRFGCRWRSPAQTRHAT